MKAIIRHGPDAANDRSTPPLISFDVDLSDKTNVVTQEPPGYLKHVEEPGLAERLRACFDPKGFEQNPRDISGEVKVTACRRPRNDVLRRRHGIPDGRDDDPEGEFHQLLPPTQKYDGPRVNEIDLVLRSNPQLALHRGHERGVGRGTRHREGPGEAGEVNGGRNGRRLAPAVQCPRKSQYMTTDATQYSAAPAEAATAANAPPLQSSDEARQTISLDPARCASGS